MPARKPKAKVGPKAGRRAGAKAGAKAAGRGAKPAANAKAGANAEPPADVDAYIAGSPKKARPKLEELRALIKSTIPEAEEKIWFGVPFYHYRGELVGLAAYKNHVSFGFGPDVLADADREQLEGEGYALGKGTMQIRFDQAVPTAVLKRIVKAKAKKNAAASRG